MDQTDVVGENFSKISLMELKSGQTKEVQAGLNSHSTWFQMPAAPIVPSSPSKEPAATLTAGSAVATAAQENAPIDLQNDSSKGNSQLAMLAILLWAGALVAIVILMLYLWRQSAAVPKQVKEKAPETPVEEKPAPTPSPRGNRERFPGGRGASPRRQDWRRHCRADQGDHGRAREQYRLVLAGHRLCSSKGVSHRRALLPAGQTPWASRGREGAGVAEDTKSINLNNNSRNHGFAFALVAGIPQHAMVPGAFALGDLARCASVVLAHRADCNSSASAG